MAASRYVYCTQLQTLSSFPQQQLPPRHETEPCIWTATTATVCTLQTKSDFPPSLTLSGHWSGHIQSQDSERIRKLPTACRQQP